MIGLAKVAFYAWEKDDPEFATLKADVDQKYQTLQDTPSPHSMRGLKRLFQPNKYQQVRNDYMNAVTDYYQAHEKAHNRSLGLFNQHSEGLIQQIVENNKLRDIYHSLNTEEERAQFRKEHNLEDVYQNMPEDERL